MAASNADDDGTANTLAGPPARHFIPFRRRDLLEILCEEGGLSGASRARFDAGVGPINRHFAEEFHELRQALKDDYAPLDPDADTRCLAPGKSTAIKPAERLASGLAELLDRANYVALGDKALKQAFRSASLFQVRLRVDLKEFDDVLLYCRGASERRETLRVCFGLFKREVRFVNYQRVVLYLRFADRGQDPRGEYPGGSVMIKLFQNVPNADLEMLFPNTRVAMRWIDRLFIGIPALASGLALATTKLGAPLLLLATLIGYWLGVQNEPVALDKKSLLVIGAGVGALGAYMWKQWSSYTNRKARFRQALTRNLYFKLLDNNGGVLLRILDDAEDSECKEAFTALYFLCAAPEGLSAAALDQRVETWFLDHCGARIDFDIEDALGKLESLGLAEGTADLWKTCPVEPTFMEATMEATVGATTL